MRTPTSLRRLLSRSELAILSDVGACPIREELMTVDVERQEISAA